MKNIALIPVLLLSLTSVNALAEGYTCNDLTLGTITPLVADPKCSILQEKAAHFPDVTFLKALGVPADQSCFTGKITAMLGKTPVTGTSYSGLTLNEVNSNPSQSSFLTAATVIKLNAGSLELGRVYTKDVVFTFEGKELLTMVGGSKTFNGGYGNLVITGNALAEPTRFTGKLCTEN